MNPTKTTAAVSVPHRYQVEERQARLLADDRRDRIRAKSLFGDISARLEDHRFLRTRRGF